MTTSSPITSSAPTHTVLVSGKRYMTVPGVYTSSMVRAVYPKFSLYLTGSAEQCYAAETRARRIANT